LPSLPPGFGVLELVNTPATIWFVPPKPVDTRIRHGSGSVVAESEQVWHDYSRRALVTRLVSQLRPARRKAASHNLIRQFILINLVGRIDGTVDSRAVPEIEIPIGALSAIAVMELPHHQPQCSEIFIVKNQAGGPDGYLGLNGADLVIELAEAVMTKTLFAKSWVARFAPMRP